MWANTCRLFRIVLFLGLCTGLVASSLIAQESKGQPDEKKKDDGKEQPPDKVQVIPFWESDVGLDVAASMQCIAARPVPGIGVPWSVFGARFLLSHESMPLDSWHFRFDTALPISQRFLDVIQDGRKFPDMRARELKELEPPDRGLYLAYLQALSRSHDATIDMFEKSADGSKNVVYTHLASAAKDHRGKVITIKGKISHIREWPAPPSLLDEGIEKIYTTYIVGPTKGAPPFAVVFTELPKKAEVSERLNLDVTFHGYFLAHIRFPADKERGSKDIVSPWLIGKTLTVDPPQKAIAAKDEETPYSYIIIVSTLGGIVVIGVLVVLLNIWFGRGDKRVQSRLAEVRDRQNPFNLEPADEAPTEEAKGTEPPKMSEP